MPYADMKHRTLVVAVVILFAALVFLGWRHFQLTRQVYAAGFLAYQCELTQQLYIDDQSNLEALALRLQFLIPAYEYRSRSLKGSSLAKVVERDYRRTLTNAITAFRRNSTNDLGDDPRVWMKKYGVD